MKAIILPPGHPERLDPITRWMPELMLPVVNKPVAEHLIELLVRNDIKEIILILEHMPYETETYFGKGERWGARISYALVKEYAGIASSLDRVKSRLDGDFLFLPGDMVTDLNISDFISAHEKGAGQMTIYMHEPDEETGTLVELTPDEAGRDQEFGPAVMTPECLSAVLSGPPARDMGQVIAGLLDEKAGLYAYRAPDPFRRIGSIDEYLEINKRVLNGEFDGLIIPGKQIRKGVWIGRHSQIHPEAEISPPLLIGSYCNVRKETAIGENTVIGNNVFVDQGASIRGSVILDGTYIGAHTEIRESIIRKSDMIDTAKSVHVHVTDDFILGDMDRKVLSVKGERLYNLLVALLLLAMGAPVIIVLYLYHLAFPSKRYFFSEKRFGGSEVVDLQGNRRPRAFTLYGFRSRNRIIRKLPGLFNVIKGDMNLVGISPLTAETVDAIEAEWEEMRFRAPAGLVHLWEVESGPDITEEEKLVSENYYAMTRTFRGDVKILLKSFLPRFIRNKI